jgi:hypothetical protein
VRAAPHLLHYYKRAQVIEIRFTSPG